MKYCIYKITHKETGKIYVGQHKCRENEQPRSYMGKGGLLLQDYKKYGRKAFSKEILEYVEDDEQRRIVDEREKYWIAKLGANKTGYNVNPGGRNTCLPCTVEKVKATRMKHGGYIMSDHTKKLISISNKGKPKSVIHRQHLSENHRTKKEHIIEFDDGRDPIKTYDAITVIAKKFNVDSTTLRRKSIKGLFHNGIRLPELIGIPLPEPKKPYELCIDPIKNDTCTWKALYIRKKKHPDLYKNVDVNACLIKGN